MRRRASSIENWRGRPQLECFGLAPGRDAMALNGPDSGPSLVERVETRVRELTRGRIRDLVVEERDARVFVSGQVPSRHVKQLAFQGILEMISGERFSEEI